MNSPDHTIPFCPDNRMHLSKKAEYALRATIHLGMAAEMGRSTVSGAELAEANRLPLKFVERILQELREAGIVETTAWQIRRLLAGQARGSNRRRRPHPPGGRPARADLLCQRNRLSVVHLPGRGPLRAAHADDRCAQRHRQHPRPLQHRPGRGGHPAQNASRRDCPALRPGRAACGQRGQQPHAKPIPPTVFWPDFPNSPPSPRIPMASNISNRPGSNRQMARHGLRQPAVQAWVARTISLR